MNERRAILFAGVLIAAGVLLMSLSACGAGGDDAGDAGEGGDETYLACRGYLADYNSDPDCTDRIREDQCTGESDATCYRPEMWRCLRQNSYCYETEMGTFARGEVAQCDRECSDGGTQ